MDFAYLAGLIDGEGCITMYAKKDKKAVNGYSFAPMIRIASKDWWFLEEVRKIFGGSLEHGGKSAFNRNQIYDLRFSSNECRAILPEIIPFLILKKQEATVLKDALDITKHHRESGYDKSKVMPLVAELKRLKKERTLFINNN